MFSKTNICKAIAIACGASAMLASPALAQSSQRIEVTGSAIKRVGSETPVPIEIITRAEITRSGATSINELIKNISVIDINDQGEQSANSPGGSGTSRIRLRGLGESQTLVLVNGRRVPKNPLADATGAGSAFNINSIPIRAIERIEILKDGGSAIYGADAVAGVVNFILRKDFTGMTAGVTLGESSRGDASEQAVSAIAGWGDLNTSCFNLMAAFDYFKRDPIFRADRELTRSVDFRRFGPIPGYNLDGRSVFSPEGNYLTASGALAGQTVRPCPTENQSGAFCVYDFNASLLTSYNPADRISGMANATIQINPNTTGYVRLFGSESKDYFEAHPVPDFFVAPVGSPFPQYAGRFMQGGPRITDKKGTLLHVDAGVEGVWGNLDWKIGLSSGEAKTTNRDRNYYNRTLWNAATRSGSIDATSLRNDSALVESLKVSPVRTGGEKLQQVDGQVAGDLFKLKGGSVRYAVGLSAWNESIDDVPDPLQVQNLVVGSIAQSVVSAKREAYAVFSELQVPVTKTVEGQIALRYDDYDSASSTSPKVALKWQASPLIALRGSFAKSFKMPTLKQQFASAGQGAITLSPGQCQQVGNSATECANGLPAFRRTGSNPGLQPEFGKTYTLGVIGETGPFSISVDWFDIKKSDNISALSLQSAIDNGFFIRDDQNRVVVLLDLRNFAQSQNTGVDVDARLRFRGLPVVGDLTVRGTGTYYTYQRSRTTSTSAWAEFTGTYSTPRWRTTLSATSVTGPWTVQGLLRTTDGFYDTAVAKQGWTATTPGKDRLVPSYQELDVTVSWEGVKNLKLTGSVKNLLDKMPPFSAQNASSNNYSQMGFAELYNVRGRFFQVSAEYNF